MDTLHEAIIGKYMETDSVKDTATALNLSVITVRRHLITANLWRSNTSDAVGKLYAEGRTISEIASELCMSEKNVHSYLPYTKGSYQQSEKSADAVWSKNYRERMKVAKEKQLVGASSVSSRAPSTGIPQESPDSHPASEPEPPYIIHLRLELDLADATPEDRQILAQYARMKEGIMRDFLLPSSMTLHALHYAIQRAFGWQNCHPHYYSLPERVFSSLTGGGFDEWSKLCGIYFRFPSADDSDLYWDNDYDGTVSIKSWFRSKYCGPYSYGGTTEFYSHCQEEVKNLIQHLPSIRILSPNAKSISDSKKVPIGEVSLSDLSNSVSFESGFDNLLERLTIGEIIQLVESRSVALDDQGFPASNPDVLHYYYDFGAGWHITITRIAQVEDEGFTDILSDERPLCVSHDGLCVLDDVHGVSGYCDLLRALNNTASPKSEAMKEWANQQGWTGRNSKSELIL